MGFRYRKRLGILPGLWLNLSRSGISASVGGPRHREHQPEGPPRERGLAGIGSKLIGQGGGSSVSLAALPARREGPLRRRTSYISSSLRW